MYRAGIWILGPQQCYETYLQNRDMKLTYTAGLRYLCRAGIRNLRIEQGNKTFVYSRDIQLNHTVF